MLAQMLLDWALFPSSANASDLGYEEGDALLPLSITHSPYNHSQYTFLAKASMSAIERL